MDRMSLLGFAGTCLCLCCPSRTSGLLLCSCPPPRAPSPKVTLPGVKPEHALCRYKQRISSTWLLFVAGETQVIGEDGAALISQAGSAPASVICASMCTLSQTGIEVCIKVDVGVEGVQVSGSDTMHFGVTLLGLSLKASGI